MNNKNDSLTRSAGSLNNLDPLLQHRTRLGVLVLLADADALSFARIRELLQETDGNLGAHLRKLEEAGYIEVKKEFVERKPISWHALSGNGFKALKKHLRALEETIEMLKGAGKG